MEFPLDATLAPVTGHWSNYAMTSAKRIANNFASAGRPLMGADIVFASDLPPAAGMSSSSASLTLIFLILAQVNRLSEREEYQREIKSREDLAGYLGTVENGQNFGLLAGDKGVGTFGGSEDHTAMLCCTPRQFSQYSFRPVVAHQRVDLPANWTLAIATSGIIAEKTGGAREGFNRLARIMSVLVDTLNTHYHSAEPHLAALIRAHPQEPPAMLEFLRRSGGAEFSGQVLAGRFDQFFQESQQIIPAVVDACRRCDVPALGPLVDRSQSLGESGLGNQTPQTVFLAHSARTIGSVRQGGVRPPAPSAPGLAAASGPWCKSPPPIFCANGTTFTRPPSRAKPPPPVSSSPAPAPRPRNCKAVEAPPLLAYSSPSARAPKGVELVGVGSALRTAMRQGQSAAQAANGPQCGPYAGPRRAGSSVGRACDF